MLAELHTSIGSGDGEKCHEAQLVMLEPVTQQLACLWWRTAVDPNVLITLHKHKSRGIIRTIINKQPKDD